MGEDNHGPAGRGEGASAAGFDAELEEFHGVRVSVRLTCDSGRVRASRCVGMNELIDEQGFGFCEIIPDET